MTTDRTLPRSTLNIYAKEGRGLRAVELQFARVYAQGIGGNWFDRNLPGLRTAYLADIAASWTLVGTITVERTDAAL